MVNGVTSIDRSKWNKTVIVNGGTVFHSWEWARVKEMSGEKVYLFHSEDTSRDVAFPVFLRKVGKVIRVGWIPDGVFINDDNYLLIYKELKEFCRKKKLAVIFTRYVYNDYVQLSSECFYTVPWSKEKETLVINLKKNIEDIFNSFNNTTKKHIRRADKSNVKCVPMEKNDLTAFWQKYVSYSEKKGFNPTGDLSQVERLFNICKDNDSGLQIIANKTVFNDEPLGFMIIMKYGVQAREYIRVDNHDFALASYAAKMLSWESIKSAKLLGAEIYDMAGVDRKNNTGVYNYKRGFGGTLVSSSKLKFLKTLW